MYTICIVLITFHFVSIQSVQIPYDTVVCFGDSHSDTGNVYNLTKFKWPLVPPYYQGRFSNGPLWIEKLNIPTLIDYAYGSATTDNYLITGITALNTIVPGVRQQVSMYKSATNLTQMNFNRTLYVIWAGANDYYFNNYLLPSAVISSLMESINDLIQLGAKHFLILNQPPFQEISFATNLNLSSYFSNLILAHNNNLSTTIQSYRSNYSNRVFHLYDVYSLVVSILNKASTYGINSTKNCWNISTGVINGTCSTPESYLFIDEYHFTTRIHQFIADDVRQLLAVSSRSGKCSQSITAIFCCICMCIVLHWKESYHI
ncbi:unnamed protein product [Adineta ricciae]|uniref:Uncharacterized protein n=1 Tax=Adineta ricciae TaxID=249248 RepID=A0A813ZBN5_ADIRI|nr:unnamed protein product [Adineta ricciae]CAF0897103.1 unnamed protein product [Adineta ricciae]